VPFLDEFVLFGSFDAANSPSIAATLSQGLRDFAAQDRQKKEKKGGFCKEVLCFQSDSRGSSS